MTPSVRSLGLGLLLAGVALAGWQPIDSITNRDASDIGCRSNARSLAGDAAGNIHVVWRGRVAGVWQPWYSYRDASTGEWSRDTILDAVSSGVCDPACVTGPDESFYVGWNDGASGTLHLLKRDSAGLWSELDSLTGQQGDSMVSLCADDSGTAHAVWRGGGLTGSLVCYASHSDAGWSIPETLTAGGAHGSWPSIACSPDDTVTAVWVGSSGQSVVSRQRVAGSWQAPETVYVGAAAKPCVVWGGGTFHAVCLAGISTKRVLVASWSAGGWGDTVKVNQYPVAEYGVAIAAEEDGALHVAWAGNDSSSPSYNQIQYRTKPAAGTWQTQQYLTQGANSSRERASLVATNGLVQVVWSDQPAPSQPFTVRLRRYELLHDVGVMGIVQPSDTVDSGAVVQPAVWVKNYGDIEESSVPVRFSFSGYTDSETLPSLVSSETAWVRFDSVAADERGWNVATCSTSLAGDANTGNDAVTDSFFVRVQDVGADSIISPADTVYDPVLTPRVCVRNLGNVEATAVVHAWISGDSVSYHDSVVGLLPPGSTVTDSFQPWSTEPGTFTCRCSVAYTSDVHPENDMLSKQFRVVVADVGVESITAPVDTVDSAQSITPAAVVHNFGVTLATFDVLLSIGSLYSNTTRVSSLKPDSSTNVLFDTWQPRERGHLAVRCSTMLTGDRNQTNDTMCCSVFVRVESLETSQWRELKPVPLGPWRRSVNDGGCLAAVEDRLLALKGSNTREFYRYSAAADSWMVLADMPPGDSGHRVKGGAALCWDGNDAVYAVKGNNTREFWRYGIAADSWCKLAGIPEYTTRVRLSGGLVFLPATDSEEVFMVKGGNCREFLTYWVGQDEWHSRRSLPAGPDGTRARHGTCLALLGDRIFCLKGGTCEFYEYFPNGDSWRERARLPRLGRGNRRRKTGKGAALASDGSRFLYAFKGGSSNEFWRYDAGADSWTQLDGIPAGSRRRKVGRGGALAWHGGRAYALKGSGSCQFWSFDPLAALATAPRRGRDATVEAAIAPSPANQRAPGLLRCGRRAAYPVPEGTKTLLVIDAAGRVISRSAAVRPFTDLCFSRPGVYFVVMVGDSGSSATKSMVVR